MDLPQPFAYGLSRISFRAVDRARRATARALDLAPAVLGSIFTEFDAERIMARAEAVDNDPALARAPLRGLTVSIKDVYDETGIVTTAGSRILLGDAPAVADAEVVRRLKAAGAVPCGRTTMSEFAYSGLGLNPHYGNPGNARDATRITGGSSSGAALSVAHGIADVALGSDTGGSVRIPAALNGLCGFKPTRTSVSTTGVFPLSAAFDSVGPLARTIELCAAVHAVLSDTRPEATPPPARPRVGVVAEPFCSGMDAQVTADFEWALTALSAAGWQVETVALPFLGDFATLTRNLVSSEACRRHSHRFEKLENLGDQDILRRIRAGADITDGEIAEAAAERDRAIGAFAQFAAQFDAFLMPTVQMVAPRLADAETDFARINPLTLRNSSVVNFLDGCAATIPMQGEQQLATGLTLFAPGRRDWQVLTLARLAASLLAKNYGTLGTISAPQR